MYKDKSIGVVTAAYNEEDFIAEVVETMPSLVDRVYVVDDASTDRTGDILKSIKDHRLVIVNHKRRMGAGAATLSGYKRACADGIDVIAVMAGDGQMDPSILGEILDPVVEGRADYTKGNRISISQHRRGMPPWRTFGNVLLTYITRIASGYWRLSDPQNGYTAVSREVLGRIDLDKVEKGFAFENDLLIKLHICGARVANVPHPSRYRGERSKVRYPHFMVATSWLLLRGFLRRLWMEGISRGFSKTSGKGEHA